MNEKHKKRSRLIALLMVFMMVFTTIPSMAFAEPVDDAPFYVYSVDDEEITNISEDRIDWPDMMTGGTTEIPLYTVTVPKGMTEVVVEFEEEKQWYYYDRNGKHIANGNTTAKYTHVVALQDENNDGELDGLSVQGPDVWSAEFFILFEYAEPVKAMVDGNYVADIEEGTIDWPDSMTGGTVPIPLYTVTVPQGTTEATLKFDSEKVWTYYDSKGKYIAGGSWSEDTEHTVAVQDTNGDGELDGISVQQPQAWSAEFFVLFVYDGEHVHKYGDWQITEATCYAEGVKTRTCSSCPEGTEGKVESEVIPKAGHSYPDEWTVKKNATCTESGKKIRECTVCPEGTEGHVEEASISALNHDYDTVNFEVTVEPTCTTAGTKVLSCKRDGCTAETSGHTKTETMAKLGHDYDEETRICSRCQDVELAKDKDGAYLIETEADLLWFAKTVNEGFNDIDGKLTADVDLGQLKDEPGNAITWPGIGTATYPFRGSFDGQNHTITLDGSVWGVFSRVMGTNVGNDNYNLKEAAVIKNVITDGTSKNTPLIHIGGYMEVSNCVNKADVKGNNACVAGIVGSVAYALQYNSVKYSYVKIENCINEGEINGKSCVGGILGEGLAGTTVIGCANTGNIIGGTHIGGLVGYLQEINGTCAIKNSYNTGKVTGDTAAGGIIGSLFNGAEVSNCYNTGVAPYAIAGNIYNNTVSITNTYYLGMMGSHGTPYECQTGVALNTAYYGTSVTTAYMSSEDFAKDLGDGFKQSCPSPVFENQNTAEHNLEGGICTVCKTGNTIKEEYKITFVLPDGAEVVGDTTVKEGNDYTFSVNILDGYYADGFGVTVNSASVTAVDGVYTVEQPNGPFYIVVTGIKALQDRVPITLPGTGNGYRVNLYDGYNSVVESGKDFKFTVDFVDGFKAGDDFTVKRTDSYGDVELTPDENGVYTIESVMIPQKITVDGVDAIPGKNSVTIGFDCTEGEKLFLQAEMTDVITMDNQIEVPYFDLELYGYEKYYYNPYCYVDENGAIRGQQKAGNRETAYNVVTSMHAFIYVTEVYKLGYEPKDAGTGYSDTVDTDNDGVSDFDEAVSWTQGVGSSFMDFWGLGTNLNYHINYEYPLAYPKWGSTSDQQALQDGDLLSVHMITGNASGSGFGLFAVNDNNNKYNKTETRDSYTVERGEEIKLTHYIGTQGPNYTTKFITGPDKVLYWTEEGDESVDVTTWNRAGFGSMKAADFKTNSKGEIVIDTTDIEPGVYYIGTTGGFIKGTGEAGSDGFVSAGTECGPAYFKLTVEGLTNEEILAGAKTAAKLEIAAYKDVALYREAQQAELTKAIEEATNAIDAAEDKETVAEAVSAAKAAMDAIKTDAQLKAEEEAAAEEELAAAKTAAKLEIAAYKDASLYREAQQAELTKVIEDAANAIDAAEDTDAVAEAVSAAKVAMDAIKTDAQLKAEDTPADTPADKPATDPVINVEGTETDACESTLKDTVSKFIEALTKNPESITNVDKTVVEAVKSAIASGKSLNVTISPQTQMVDEKDAVSTFGETHVVLIEKETKGAKVAQYLDLSVQMTVTADGKVVSKGNVSKLDSPIRFTIAVPGDIPPVADGMTRIFFVVRVHGDDVTRLAVTDNGDNILSWETDLFSTYALAYEDVPTVVDMPTEDESVEGDSIVEDDDEITEEDKENGEDFDEEVVTNDEEVTDETPKTGDNSHLLFYLMILCAAVMTTVIVRKREE